MKRNLSKPVLVLDTIWQLTNRLPLRRKLSLLYTTAFLLMLGFSFFAIYIISAKYREEEFFQRLKDRTITTFTLLVDVAQIDHDLLQILDRHTINNLYEEKLLLFDSSGRVIYSSIDDTKVYYSQKLLQELQSGTSEIETSEGQYELLGIRFTHVGKVYYGINKAYDRFGNRKLAFLKWLLLVTFVVVAGLLVLLSYALANTITQPIRNLTSEIDNITTENLSVRVQEPDVSDEVGFLASKFNELLTRLENAFRFQQHFIHHLSHELKTPLAVMMGNVERALKETDNASLILSLRFQQNALMELSNIINALLEISRTESQQRSIQTDQIRVDELLFECMDELNFLNDAVQFDFRIDASIEDSRSLTVAGNLRMLKLAIINLLKNAAAYADSGRPEVVLAATGKEVVLQFVNTGKTLSESEQERLFHHLFRGQNSQHIKGFGLGLVLVQRIVTLHGGSISYQVLKNRNNCFVLRLKHLL